VKHAVLDAGAFVALERGQAAVRALVLLADRGDVALHTSAAAVARIWRGGARQARVARLLASELVVEHALDAAASRRIGILAAAAGARDVVDGHVALLALERDAVVFTSDADDVARWGVLAARIVRC